MQYFLVKSLKIKGSNPKEIIKKAKDFSSLIERSSKRHSYIKSKYFKGEKIFLKYFWTHLYQSGGWKQRSKRVSYFFCAIELIEKSQHKPILITTNRHKKSETLYRFAGITKNK